MATVRTQVALSWFTDFVITSPTDPGIVSPEPRQQQALRTLLDELVRWSGALETLRVHQADDDTAPLRA